MSYWLITLAFALTFVIAFTAYLGPWWGATIAVIALVVASTVLLWAGNVEVSVDDAGLHVGHALLEWEYLGAVEKLDAEGLTRVAGVDADVRAYDVIRPYLHEAVRVQVQDAADPHPYWLVGTRHPAALTAALNQGASER